MKVDRCTSLSGRTKMIEEEKNEVIQKKNEQNIVSLANAFLSAKSPEEKQQIWHTKVLLLNENDRHLFTDLVQHKDTFKDAFKDASTSHVFIPSKNRVKDQVRIQYIVTLSKHSLIKKGKHILQQSTHSIQPLLANNSLTLN